MMKKHTPSNSPNLSLTEKVDKLRQAGLADSDIDAILSDGNKNDSDAIEEYNRRVDETVDMAAWETKIGAVFAVIFFLVFGQLLIRVFTSENWAEILDKELGITILFLMISGFAVCLITNIRSIPLYFKNVRHFLKK
jgi:hypothetical protein